METHVRQSCECGRIEMRDIETSQEKTLRRWRCNVLKSDKKVQVNSTHHSSSQQHVLEKSTVFDELLKLDQKKIFYLGSKLVILVQIQNINTRTGSKCS